VLCGVFVAAALAAAPASAEAPTRILATANDSGGMSLILSPAAFPKASPGPAKIELHNNGEDPHDMVIRRAGGGAKHRYEELEHGESQTLALTLRPASRYKLWCTVLGHRDQGMEAELRVRKG
jgi:hypothetical protein